MILVVLKRGLTVLSKWYNMGNRVRVLRLSEIPTRSVPFLIPPGILISCAYLADRFQATLNQPSFV